MEEKISSLFVFLQIVKDGDKEKFLVDVYSFNKKVVPDNGKLSTLKKISISGHYYEHIDFEIIDRYIKQELREIKLNELGI